MQRAPEGGRTQGAGGLEGLRARYRQVQISFQMTDAAWCTVEELDRHVDGLLAPGGGIDRLLCTLTDRADPRLSHGGEAFQPAAELAKAYATPESRHYRSPALLARVEELLAHLGTMVYPGCERTGNWWAWDIGIPMRLGDILIYAGDDLLKAVRNRWTDTLAWLCPDITARRLGPDSGANGLWLAFNTFKLGLAADEPRYVRTARDAIAAICGVSAGDGIQADWSYHFHGPGLNMGYGGDQLFDVSRYIYATAGTEYQLPPSALAVHLAWIRKFIVWCMYGEGQNPYAMGRAGTRGDVGQSSVRMYVPAIVYVAASGVEGTLPAEAGAGAATGGQAGAADGGEEARPLAGYVKAWAARFGLGGLPFEARALAAPLLDMPAEPWEPRGVRYYPRSDYLAVQRGHYAAWVRMHGTQRIGWFSIHQENRRGWYAGDGTLVIMRTGREFYGGVLATQDWERLPGITRAVSDRYKRPQGKPGHSEFVTGATLAGQTGAAAMEFIVRPDEGGPPLTACKSWLAFPEGEIVALGSGIRLDADVPVETVLDQRVLDGVDVIDVGGKAHRIDRSLDLRTEASWVHAGNIGYVLLQPGIRILAAERTGRFADITAYRPYTPPPEQELRHRTLILLAEHGSRIRDGRYGAVYLPGASAEDVARYAARPAVTVLRCDASLHAVRHASGTVAVVFFRPAATPWGALDGRGILLYEPAGGGIRLTVALYGEAPRQARVWLPVAADLAAARRHPRVAAALHRDGGTDLYIAWQPEGQTELTLPLAGDGAGTEDRA